MAWLAMKGKGEGEGEEEIPHMWPEYMPIYFMNNNSIFLIACNIYI